MIDAMRSEAPNGAFAEFVRWCGPRLDSLCLQSEVARWQVSREEFAGALYRSAIHRFAGVAPAPDALEAYLNTLHLEDLALACALRRGSEEAWEHFVATYRPLLYAAARAIAGSAGEAHARELADSLYGELYGVSRSGAERASSLLDYFHGRSKLSTWLRSILAQRHVDSMRASQRLEPLDDQRRERLDGCAPAVERANGPGESIDPDRERLLPRLAAAVAEALGALSAADRLLLSLYYVQGITLAHIARMRGVHEATISRQLQNLRRALRERIESLLAQGSVVHDGQAPAKALSPAEVRRCMEYASEDWSFDLAAVLAGGAPQEKGESE
jgi:RNA polymerase sigma-70 factor (ECF subfamily)